MKIKRIYVLTSAPINPETKDVDGRKLLNGVSYEDKPLTGVLVTKEALKHYDLVEEWCKRHDNIPFEIVQSCDEALERVLEYNQKDKEDIGRFAFLTREPLAKLEALCLVARERGIKAELRIRYNGV